MFCGKCGTKLNEDAKFCGKCGTKVNKTANNTNVNNLNSFIGNIVKKNDNEAVDKDIFEQLEEETEKKPVKKVKKLSLKSVKKPKSKKKTKSKPKPKKVKKVAAKKERKKINLKVLIAIVAAVLLAIVGITSFIFFKFGDDLFANNYVLKSISKTFRQVDKYNEKTSSIPNLLLREDRENQLTEREMYLEIKESQGGLINENILGSLKGLSIKTNEKTNTEKELFNAKLTLANNKKDEIYGEVFKSPSVATINIPDLYADTLGVNLNDTDDRIFNSQYYTKLTEVIEFLTNYETSYGSSKQFLIDRTESLVTSIVENSKFEIESKDKETNYRVYNTILDNKFVLESLKTYLTEIKDNEQTKELLSYVVYLFEGNSLSTAEASLSSKINRLITSIDSSIESTSIKDIDLRLIVNGDKIIENVVFNTVIDGIDVTLNMDLKNNDESLLYNINIKLAKTDSYLSLDLSSMLEEIEDDKINRQNTITFGTSYDDEIKLSYNETYDFKSLDYKNKIDFVVDSAFENLSVGLDLDGKYKIEKDFEKLDINSFKLNIFTELYRFKFNFNGYVQQQNTNLIEESNLEDVIFIDNMTDKEIDNIKSEIYKNGIEFLDLFGKGKW